MGVLARMKSMAGSKKAATVTAATTTYVPDNANYVELSATTTATITSLIAGPTTRNRKVTFHVTSGAVTFTHTITPAANQMYLNGANRLLLAGDKLTLILTSDGSWTLDGLIN